MDNKMQLDDALIACPICLVDFEDPVTLKECGHNLCKICSIDMLKR